MIVSCTVRVILTVLDPWHDRRHRWYLKMFPRALYQALWTEDRSKVLDQTMVSPPQTTDPPEITTIIGHRPRMDSSSRIDTTPMDADEKQQQQMYQRPGRNGGRVEIVYGGRNPATRRPGLVGVLVGGLLGWKRSNCSESVLNCSERVLNCFFSLLFEINKILFLSVLLLLTGRASLYVPTFEIVADICHLLPFAAWQASNWRQ